MLTCIVISCSSAVYIFSECCHLGLALFQYVEGVFPLHIALPLCVYVCTAVCLCTAVVGKVPVEAVRQTNEPCIGTI